MTTARPIAAAIAAVVLLGYADIASSQSRVPISPTERVRVHDLLLEARSAVIKLAADSTASWDSEIADYVDELVDLLGVVEDRESMRFLQQHLRAEYAKDIRHALDPAERREDFVRRIAVAARETNVVDQERSFELIVTQQLERSTFDDAVDTASHVQSPLRRADVLGRIAIESSRNHERAAVARAVDEFIDTALSLTNQRADFDASESVEHLTRLAVDLNATDADAARRLLMSAQLAASWRENPSIYQRIALAAARIGDETAAIEALGHVKNEDLRQSIDDSLRMARVERGDLEGQQAVEAIADIDVRVRAFVSLAQRKARAGDEDTAAAAFASARQTAYLDEEHAVFNLVDIAKAQVAVGDRNGALSTLNEALVENQKVRWGGDQLRGWDNIAKVSASAGEFDRAFEVAAKIKEPRVRASALGGIAYHQTMASQAATVLNWARTLKGPAGRTAVFLSIASAIVDSRSSKP